jgi:methionyl-tRNA formyltransferase
MNNMNILVLSDNAAILEKAKPIFLKREDCKWIFTNSDDINPKLDYRHICKTYELVFSLHCKKIFPKQLLDNIRCVNIHPGLKRGMFTHVHDMVYEHDSGSCIHIMDEEIDHGQVICHTHTELKEGDTSESFYNRIIDDEMKLLDEYLDLIIKGSLHWSDHDYLGHTIYMLKDFKKLCDIDPDSIGTFRQFYNLLRALSHGEYWNARIKGTNINLKLLINENPPNPNP